MSFIKVKNIIPFFNGYSQSYHKDHKKTLESLRLNRATYYSLG